MLYAKRSLTLRMVYDKRSLPHSEAYRTVRLHALTESRTDALTD